MQGKILQNRTLKGNILSFLVSFYSKPPGLRNRCQLSLKNTVLPLLQMGSKYERCCSILPAGRGIYLLVPSQWQNSLQEKDQEDESHKTVIMVDCE